VIRRRLVAVCVLVVATAASALAHDRSVSYSQWRIDGPEARVVVRIAELELTRFPWARGDETTARLAEMLPDELRLTAGREPCALAEVPRRLEAEPGTVAVEWRVRCAEARDLAIEDDWLFGLAARHLHFATVTRDGGEPVERVLTENDRVWRLAVATGGATRDGVGSSLGEYVLLGIEHIASGYDHLAFLLALLLVAASLGEVAGIVTGFTVAHSITLGVAAVGVLRPERAPIEALIGLSIALVAAENVWLADRRSTAPPWIVAGALALAAVAAVIGFGRVPALTLGGLAIFALSYFELLSRVAAPHRLRWAVAFLFGLLHGFGFAAALVDARLPAERLVRALFGFNIGVELGQLVVVAALWPLLGVIRARARGGAILEAGSIAVLALGVFWFVVRAYG